MKPIRRLFLACALIPAAANATDYYVSTSGNDTTGTGALATPFATIQKAANTAVAGDNVIIRAGTYRETVRPANSGTNVAPITYRAYEAGGVYEEVIISGADPVTGWTAHDTSGGKAIYKTTTMGWNLSDTGASFGTAYRNQIFVNGQMQVLARWPNVPAERITRLTYQDLALVSAGSGSAGSTATSAWIENANIAGTFPANYWSDPARATARVFLSPATMIWGMSVKIASQSSNRLTLDATGSGFSFLSPYYYPTTNNRFFIYDYYDALDTAGEYWKDTATNTLYLWAPAGANPATLAVEAKRRDFGLSLGSRSYLTFTGIKLFACTVDSDAASKDLTFSEIEARYIAHIDSYAPTFTTAANAREFYLRGDGHVVEDSYFNGSAVGVIGASGTNMLIENNVIRDFGYGHHGGAIFARNGGIYGNRTLATKNQFLHNTAFNAGHTIATTDPALDIKYNRFYNSHLRGSDIGAVGIASTDGLGSEIAYNVISDALGPKDNGVLYGGFGIYFDFECRNFTVHHNIVYNTTGNSYQFMPNRASELSRLGVTNVGMKFYHNSGTGGFGIIEPQDAPGVDVRNNLVRIFGSAGGTYAGLPNVQFSNNTAYGTDATAPFRDRARGDLRFASGSSTGVNAGTVISPYSDGFLGVAPDTGAIEFDLAPFIAGATFTQRQLAGLTATSLAITGALIDIQLGNLPEGRSPPNTFQAKIGSEAFGGTLAYDYPTNTWRLLGVSKGALTGLQTVSVRLSGIGATATLDAVVDVGGGVPAPEVAVRGNDVNITDGDSTPSGADHTVFSDIQFGDTIGTTQTYTIYNYGTLPLTITGVTFTGANAADFSLDTAPASSVAAGASTTLILRFIPSDIGMRTARVHIVNNDSDEGDFDFAIQGQGTTPLPALNLPAPQVSAELAPSTTGSATLPIQNIGLANLTWSLASTSGTGLYSWADSASGGPAYAWYDIKSLGTRIWGGGTNTDDDYSTITLPFSFPFYGSNYTQVTLDTNGVVYPGIRTAYAYANQPLPNSVGGAPAALIAGFWDDLNVDTLAEVRTYAIDASTFVVLYDNLKAFSSSNRITFQIVFRANGQITIQYQDNQFTRSYTIGLQNPARTLGPQVAYSGNTGTIQGLQLPVGSGINRAISFYPPASFVTGFTPTSGSIAAGGSTAPAINLSSAGLSPGTYQTTLTLTANDANALSTQIPVTLQVITPAAPVITASQSATGTIGSAFSYQLAANNIPTSYALASGTLPTGVTLNTTTGLLSGTPSTTGTYTPAFTATNASGTSPAVAVTLTIAAPPVPAITSSQSASGAFGVAFSYQLTSSNTPTSYALANGTLPNGVTLNTTTGLLSGTPSTFGTYTPAFTATNANGTSPAVVVTLNIAAPPVPVITAGQSAAGTSGFAFSYQLTSSNTPTSYALASGTLPTGVTLNTTTGLLSGTPTTSGTFTPSFTATNGGGSSPAVSVTLTISVLPANRTWDGTGSDSLWSTAANWDADQPAPQSPDNATFPASTGKYAPSLSTPASLGNLLFTGANSYTLGGTGPLTLSGGISKAGSTVNQTINPPIILSGQTATFDNSTAVSGNLALGGNVTGTGDIRVLSTTEYNLVRFYGASAWTGDLILGNFTDFGSARFDGTGLPSGTIRFEPKASWGNILTFGTGSAQTFAVTNPITFSAGATDNTGNIGFNLATGASVTMNGIITSADTAKTPALVQFSLGTSTALTLAGSNNFTGIPTLRFNDTGNATSVKTLRFGPNAFTGAPSVFIIQTVAGDASNRANFKFRATDAGMTVPQGWQFGGQSLTTGLRTASVGGDHASGTVTFSGTMDLSSANWTNSANWADFAADNSGATTIVSGLINDGTNTQPVTISGDGTVRFTRAAGNTYDGGTTINTGSTLLVENTSGSATGSAAVTVASSATLGGTGIIAGPVTLATGGKLAFALSTFASSHDKLDITGALALGTSSTLSITATAAAAPGTYTLVTAADGITGSLPVLNLPVNWSASLQISGNNLDLVVSSVGTALATFRTSYGLAADGSQDLLTPAGDGVQNLLKYAFNMIGNGPGQVPALATPNAAILTASGTAGLPLVGVESSTGKLQLTYIRRKSATAPGITYVVEFSNDLGVTDPWATNSSATESATSIDATFERVTVTDSVASPAKRFARVKVTAP